MTKAYLIQKPAGEVMMGDKLSGWAFRTDGVHPAAARVTDIKKKGKQIMIVTPEYSILVYPEMLVSVEVMA